MGNTESVANEHYLMLTDEHFERAAGANQKPAQKAAQYIPDNDHKERKTAESEKTEIAVSTGKNGD
jgi:hypothetical protein